MLVKTFGSAVFGVDARRITIEVDHGGGGEFVMVGLPDNAVKESKERVKTAIRHCGFAWPRGRIIINMAPADMKKEGAAYDLPLALGILAARLTRMHWRAIPSWESFPWMERYCRSVVCFQSPCRQR
jgi:magnesium chelatase family protein